AGNRSPSVGVGVELLQQARKTRVATTVGRAESPGRAIDPGDQIARVATREVVVGIAAARNPRQRIKRRDRAAMQIGHDAERAERLAGSQRGDRRARLDELLHEIVVTLEVGIQPLLELPTVDRFAGNVEQPAGTELNEPDAGAEGIVLRLE